MLPQMVKSKVMWSEYFTISMHGSSCNSLFFFSFSVYFLALPPPPGMPRERKEKRSKNESLKQELNDQPCLEMMKSGLKDIFSYLIKDFIRLNFSHFFSILTWYLKKSKNSIRIFSHKKLWLKGTVSREKVWCFIIWGVTLCLKA